MRCIPIPMPLKKEPYLQNSVVPELFSCFARAYSKPKEERESTREPSTLEGGYALNRVKTVYFLSKDATRTDALSICLVLACL